MVCHTAILLKDDMAQVSDLQNSLAKNQTVLKNRACGYDEIRKFCHIDKLPSPLANPEDVDILEQNIRELSPYLLKILLQDKTTGRYIRWACDEYAKYGEAYTAEKEIFPELITGPNTKIIQPRIAKSKEDQLNRTRKSAEVFTPSWICAEMNNLCDEEWFGEPNVFNQVIDKTWEPTLNKISFKETNKRKKAEWQRYVDSKRLEITCGEAPFLVSRYDTTTGEVLPIIKRIGLLDRKLRIVNENTYNEADWFVWTKRAYESTYGYEYQGDNLLLARENLLWTFIDNYKYKFQQFPAIAHLKQIANIIAWNIWQMDGLKECAPFVASEASQLELFNDLPTLSFPIICRVKDWRNKLVFYFRDLKGDKKMKFDVIIGNPPYQVSDGGGTGDSAKPVYNEFIDNAKVLSQHLISMICPSRWMKGGKGLDIFRENMMNDTHLKCIYDFESSSEFFPNVHIDGGVNYFIWDAKFNGKCKFYHKAIDGFQDFSIRYIKNNLTTKVIRDSRQISVIEKARSKKENTFNTIVSARNAYGYYADLFNEPQKYPLANLQMNWYENSLKIYGVKGKKGGAKRITGFVQPLENQNNQNINSYKLFFSKAYMTTSTVPPEVIIGEPNTVSTETFLQIGPFSNKKITLNCLSYIKTKFFRALLFYNRHSLNISRESFSLIPLQDFTENSDINWSKSIPEIDAQLYQKYGLTKDEIDFIESMIKPME